MGFKGDLEAVVLGTLQNEGLHGYEIARRIRLIDEGALNAREGKLYPLLHRLENEQYVESTWIPQEGKPPRKVYSLTVSGRLLLEQHQKAWKAFTNSIEAVLHSGEGEDKDKVANRG